MKIKSCSFNIFFPVELEMRKHLFEFEKSLKGFITPFNLLPIPDGAPPEFPRITSTSEHGHTQLNITLQNLQMITKFDENFEESPDKCFEYIDSKINPIISGISSIIGKDKMLFSGITSEVEFSGNDNCGAKLAEKFMNLDTQMNILDINSRVTFEYEGKYYINVSIENTRTYTGIKRDNLSMAGLTQIGEGIQVSLDINDRLAFNKDELYRTSETDINFISQFSKSLIDDKLEKFVRNGAF